MSISRDLPIGAVRFPHRCLGCGAPPTKTFEITAARGIDLILVAIARRVWIPVPVCDACHRRRWLTYIGAVLALVGAIVGLIAVYVMLQKGNPQIKESGMGGIVIVTLVIMWWARNRLERHIDAILFGVAGITVLSKENKVRLAFRDEGLAREIASLSTGEGTAPELDVETA